MNGHFRNATAIAVILILCALGVAEAGSHRRPQKLQRAIDRIERAQADLDNLDGHRIRDARRHLEQAELLLQEARRKSAAAGGHTRGHLVFSFVKQGHGPQKLRTGISHLTRDRSYDRLICEVGGNPHSPLILNQVRVNTGGHWQNHSFARSLPPGRHNLRVPIPVGSEVILMSVSQGQGARISVSMR